MRKREDTIRRAERVLLAAVVNPDNDERSKDQCYGAAEALNWVLGNGPPVIGLIKPLGAGRLERSGPT